MPTYERKTVELVREWAWDNGVLICGLMLAVCSLR